ncbi:MAG: agmatinase family protein [Planctomycetota bacterium]
MTDTHSTFLALPESPDEARVVILPVPFDATTSYGTGTARGPDAILAASAQVDLHDHRFGEIHLAGLHMEAPPSEVKRWSSEARSLAAPLLDGLSPDEAVGPEHEGTLAKINELCAQAYQHTHDVVLRVLDQGRVPIVVGGEHSVSEGAIAACADRFGSLGVLQIDAHMDLRDAYQGLSRSHASVMFNAIHEGHVSRLVQVGIRDYCREELDLIERLNGENEGWVSTWYDDDLFDAEASGTGFQRLAERIVDELPETVYVTVDIDGLDPSLCPNTGTPVPGGLSFRHLSLLLGTLRDSGKRIVGADLVEVCPDASGTCEWDANVGARVLYKLCGLVAPSV